MTSVMPWRGSTGRFMPTAMHWARVLRKSMTAAVRVDDLDVTQIAERCRRLITRGRKNTLHCTLGYCQINIH